MSSDFWLRLCPESLSSILNELKVNNKVASQTQCFADDMIQSFRSEGRDRVAEKLQVRLFSKEWVPSKNPFYDFLFIIMLSNHLKFIRILFFCVCAFFCLILTKS